MARKPRRKPTKRKAKASKPSSSGLAPFMRRQAAAIGLLAVGVIGGILLGKHFYPDGRTVKPGPTELASIAPAEPLQPASPVRVERPSAAPMKPQPQPQPQKPAPSKPAAVPATVKPVPSRPAADNPQPSPQVPTMQAAPPTAGLPDWLRFAVPVANERIAGKKLIAIVLDDVGVAPAQGWEAVALPAPLTLSIMTYAKEAPALAQAARARGHEVMVHMPMQPLDPQQDPGPNALLVDLPPAEIARRLDWGLTRFSGYVGFNNHMGSRFTQDEAGMRIVLEKAKARGLLFLDSKTIGGSVANRMAGDLGVVHVARDVFLDDDMSEAAVRQQLAETEQVARRQGYAIAIGHPHPATLRALAAWLPQALRRGFAIVPVTAIARKKTGLDG